MCPLYVRRGEKEREEGREAEGERQRERGREKGWGGEGYRENTDYVKILYLTKYISNH